MRILLTGGSGDVGTLLTIDLVKRGDQVVNIDMAAPKVSGATFVKGSILDRDLLSKSMQGVDCVVHIAAWHGIHENIKTPAEFHDLNVTGTFNALQAASEAGVKNFVFVSSTSVADAHGLYGASKLIGEKMTRDYAEHTDMTCIILRPRAFIPSWNKAVYNNFLEWAHWFMRGAVHVNDFKDAVIHAIDLKTNAKAPVYVIDGAYDYNPEDLAAWDKDGPGSTFRKYYSEFIDLTAKHGIDISRKPRVLDIPAEQHLPGYAPRYTMKNLLRELAEFGLQGPPAPFESGKKTASSPKP